MSKFKKIDREFLITDNTVNCYGFRLLTSGYQSEEYLKNPIGYYMHLRDKGVLVRWEDFRFDGDNVYAKPVINLSNERAQQTIDEIENKFLNGASVGHIVAIEWTDDPALKLPGQTGPTITKWFNRECSLCDIPGNFGALALYDKDDNLINLADFTKPNLDMKQIIFTGSMLAAMNLKAEADDATVAAAFNDLVAKAAKADQLAADLQAKNDELANLKDTTTKKEVESLTAKGVADGKITVEVAKELNVAYAKNPTSLKNLLDAMPVYQPISSNLGGKEKKEAKDLSAKSFDELFESGELEDLKANNPELYKKKWKEEFGTEPKM